MSCNICQAKFSFFTKEVACPGCGYSHCGKCLKYKCTIPDGRVAKVCGRCYNNYNSVKKVNSLDRTAMSHEQEESLALVDITKKLDSLENPAKPPIVMYKHANHWDKFKSGLEPVDQVIVDRLRKLKEKDKSSALSVDEIRKRLALLKDEDPGGAGNSKTNIHLVDLRTDQQKTDDLIQEYLSQLELTSGSDPISEIHSRLRSLRGLSNIHERHSDEITDDDDDDGNDEETRITKKLIAKALAEAALEKQYEEDIDELEDMEVDTSKRVYKEDKEAKDEDEEKPTCVMCDESRNLEKCLGCYGDLYCSACYENNHDESEMKKHKKIRSL
ncbi:abscission/NoCut checkpoint regulator [Megalopta genalis]|uniref:abscission/NoCut checkpoint regulator n=1 Tax=Megalopta genalis TaxID=115081 RepID=UPI003FD4E968